MKRGGSNETRELILFININGDTIHAYYGNMEVVALMKTKDVFFIIGIGQLVLGNPWIAFLFLMMAVSNDE